QGTVSRRRGNQLSSRGLWCSGSARIASSRASPSVLMAQGQSFGCRHGTTRLKCRGRDAARSSVLPAFFNRDTACHLAVLHHATVRLDGTRGRLLARRIRDCYGVCASYIAALVGCSHGNAAHCMARTGVVDAWLSRIRLHYRSVGGGTGHSTHRHGVCGGTSIGRYALAASPPR